MSSHALLKFQLLSVRRSFPLVAAIEAERFASNSVRREIEVFPAPVDTSYTFDSTPLNRAIEAASLPPGLRFPDGAIVGRHLVVFGTHLAPNANVLCIWALDLGEDGPHGIAARAARGEKLAWQRVDPGSVLARGSWNRGVVWKNSLVVLGDRGELPPVQTTCGTDEATQSEIWLRTTTIDRSTLRTSPLSISKPSESISRLFSTKRTKLSNSVSRCWTSQL